MEIGQKIASGEIVGISPDHKLRAVYDEHGAGLKGFLQRVNSKGVWKTFAYADDYANLMVMFHEFSNRR